MATCDYHLCENEIPRDSRRRRYCSGKCSLVNRVYEYRIRLKQRCIDYKGGKCELCGYDKCPAALTFHHRDPTKKSFGIGSVKIVAWKKLRPELDKCDLLCANCHAEIHA